MSTKSRSRVDKCWPKSTKADQRLPEIDQDWHNNCQSWLPTLADVGRCWIGSGQTRPNRSGTDQHWPNLGQIWPEFGQTRPEIDGAGPALACNWPTMARVRPHLVRNSLVLGHPPKLDSSQHVFPSAVPLGIRAAVFPERYSKLANTSVATMFLSARLVRSKAVARSPHRRNTPAPPKNRGHRGRGERRSQGNTPPIRRRVTCAGGAPRIMPKQQNIISLGIFSDMMTRYTFEAGPICFD